MFGLAISGLAECRLRLGNLIIGVRAVAIDDRVLVTLAEK
jgi:hypothetical protein